MPPMWALHQNQKAYTASSYEMFCLFLNLPCCCQSQRQLKKVEQEAVAVRAASIYIHHIQDLLVETQKTIQVIQYKFKPEHILL